MVPDGIQKATKTSLEPSVIVATKRENVRLKWELMNIIKEQEILKKSQHFLHERRMKYTLIDPNTAEFRVWKMYHMLEMIQSKYYTWQRRIPSTRSQTSETLLKLILVEYENSHKTYRSPSIQIVLGQKGIVRGIKQVAWLMQLKGTEVQKRHKRHSTTTKLQTSIVTTPNWLTQEFTALVFNRKWVSNFAIIDMAEG